MLGMVVNFPFSKERDMVISIWLGLTVTVWYDIKKVSLFSFPWLRMPVSDLL